MNDFKLHIYRKYQFWNAYYSNEALDFQYTIIKAFRNPQQETSKTFGILQIGDQEAEICQFENFEILLSPLQEID